MTEDFIANPWELFIIFVREQAFLQAEFAADKRIRFLASLGMTM